MSETGQIVRNPPVCAECRECGSPVGHNASCSHAIRARNEEIETLRVELTRLQQANAALVDLVRGAYSEGMSEGMKEYTSSKGGKPWFDSKAKQRLEALASQ